MVPPPNNTLPRLTPVTESFSKLQAWMLEKAPGVIFRPPANPAAVDNFAAKSGLKLPDALRQVLSVADGEVRFSTGAIGNWRLMPITEIQAAWGLLTQLANQGAYDGLSPDHSPYLVNAWWHPGWIPIVTSDTGGYFCIDTDPPDPQRAGQVLLFFQEQPARPLVASSLTAWLARIILDLQEGIYTFDEDEGFNGEAFLWSSLEGKHLLDAIEGTLIVKDEDRP